MTGAEALAMAAVMCLPVMASEGAEGQTEAIRKAAEQTEDAGTVSAQTEDADEAAGQELPDSYPLSSKIKDALYVGDLTEFSAYTVDGEEITQEDLADYDLTMINFWTTWCTYCLYEMPELANLQKNVPDNVQVLTCCLSYEDLEEVRSLNHDSGYEGITITEPHGEMAVIANNILSFPITLFFDSKGRAVGTGVIGYMPEADVFYSKLINELLGEMGILEGTEAETETEAETKA